MEESFIDISNVREEISLMWIVLSWTWGRADDTHPYGRKQRTKEPLDEGERGKWKSWYKTQHSEN